MDALQFLQSWYAAQCNGDWEHQYGVRIETLDNPGWSIAIDLTERSLEEAAFDAVTRGEVGRGDWLLCRRDGGRFLGSCGRLQLTELLEVFHRWAQLAHMAESN